MNWGREDERVNILGVPAIVQGYRSRVILSLDDDWNNYLSGPGGLNAESLLLLEIARRIGSRYEISLGPSFTGGCLEEGILSTLYLHTATGDIVVRLASSFTPYSMGVQAETWSSTTAVRKISSVGRILRGAIEAFTRQAINKWPVFTVKERSEWLTGVRVELGNLARGFPVGTIAEFMKKAVVTVTYEIAHAIRAPLTRVSAVCSSQSFDELNVNTYHERVLLEVDMGEDDNVVIDIAARYQENPLLAELVAYIADRAKRRKWMRLARILAGRIHATLYEALGEG